MIFNKNIIGFYWIEDSDIIVEIRLTDGDTYTIIRHVSGIEIPYFCRSKREAKKYVKVLQPLTYSEKAKFLLNKEHI